METVPLLTFLGLVALGAYVQTVSGYAIALIVTGGATALGLAPLAFTANVVSFVALANIVTAVHRQHSHIHRAILGYGTAGVLLFTGVGLWVLNHLSSSASDFLEMLLGVVILGSGVAFMIHPHVLAKPSGNLAHFVAGSLGGILSGLYGAGGPPIMVHLYRQPMPFAAIRITLLAVLGAIPFVRLSMEGVAGHLDREILLLSLYSVPVSVLVTLFARRFPPPVSETTLRRFGFALLCVIGISLIVGKS
jgi:uncharacterized protein